jgi:hypothetical protein
VSAQRVHARGLLRHGCDTSCAHHQQCPTVSHTSLSHAYSLLRGTLQLQLATRALSVVPSHVDSQMAHSPITLPSPPLPSPPFPSPPLPSHCFIVTRPPPLTASSSPFHLLVLLPPLTASSSLCYLLSLPHRHTATSSHCLHLALFPLACMRRRGIDKNLDNPTPNRIVASNKDDPGLFVEDFRIYPRIDE